VNKLIGNKYRIIPGRKILDFKTEIPRLTGRNFDVLPVSFWRFSAQTIASFSIVQENYKYQKKI